MLRVAGAGASGKSQYKQALAADQAVWAQAVSAIVSKVGRKVKKNLKNKQPRVHRLYIGWYFRAVRTITQ